MNSGGAQREYRQENLRESSFSLLEEVTADVLFQTSKFVLYV